MLKIAVAAAVMFAIMDSTSFAKVKIVKGTDDEPLRIISDKPIDPRYVYGCYDGHRFVRDGVNGWIQVSGGCKKGDSPL
jgi:hypothetical protein